MVVCDFLLMVCGRLLMFCGGFLLFAGGLWSFVVAACFSTYVIKKFAHIF